jgi:hypothetical protein
MLYSVEQGVLNYFYRTRLSCRRMIWLPLPPPSPVRSTNDTQETEKEIQLAEWKGGRQEPNHTTARKPGPLSSRKYEGLKTSMSVVLIRCSYYERKDIINIAKIKVKSKPSVAGIHVSRRSSFKGLYHEMNIFLKTIKSNKYFLNMRRWFF